MSGGNFNFNFNFNMIEVMLFLVADIECDCTGCHKCIYLIGCHFDNARTCCVGELLKFFGIGHRSPL